MITYKTTGRGIVRSYFAEKCIKTSKYSIIKWEQNFGHKNKNAVIKMAYEIYKASEIEKNKNII